MGHKHHKRMAAAEIDGSAPMRERGRNRGNGMRKRTMLLAGATALAALAIMPARTANAAETDRTTSAGELRLAQVVPEAPPGRVVRTRPRIEVYPGRPVHRECVDGYREVWRPYWGTTVVMPYMRCWWVRG